MNDITLRSCGTKPIGLAVAGVDDRERLKGARRLADADDHGAAVVHFERAAEAERIVGPELLGAVAVDDHRVGLAEVGQPACEDLAAARRRARRRRGR